MSIEELESVVSHLSAEDLTRFSEWFSELLATETAALRPTSEPDDWMTPVSVPPMTLRLEAARGL